MIVNMWWDKAAHFMVVGKQKKEDQLQESQYPFKGKPLMTSLSFFRACILKIP
jgi:hypothetical protein